jgi:hypothetical protein
VKDTTINGSVWCRRLSRLRTEHACGWQCCFGSVPSVALHTRGRACFVASVQPAAVVYVLLTVQVPGRSGMGGSPVVELMYPLCRK